VKDYFGKVLSRRVAPLHVIMIPGQPYPILPCNHIIPQMHVCAHHMYVCTYHSPTLGAHTHAHAHGFCDVIVHGWAWVGIGFVHPCIQLQIGVKLLGCREYANQEALRAEASDNKRPFICPIQPRLGVGR
jgi:hypothetical protein